MKYIEIHNWNETCHVLSASAWMVHQDSLEKRLVSPTADLPDITVVFHVLITHLLASRLRFSRLNMDKT